MRKAILISVMAATAAAFGATAAAAQTASEFSGFYVGAHGAYGKVDNDGGTDVEGGLGGIHGGYNYVNGAALFGIEGDYSWSNLSYSETASGMTVDVSVNYFASLRGRLGWIYGSRTLFYATAGYSWSEIEGKVTISGLGSASESFDLDGAVLGGGVEYKFSNAFGARLEGLHYWGGNDEISDEDAEINIIRAGLSYYFK